MLRGNVRRVKSYVDVTDKNYKLLEILDAIKDYNAATRVSPDIWRLHSQRHWFKLAALFVHPWFVNWRVARCQRL
jgi:hypothetical protein